MSDLGHIDLHSRRVTHANVSRLLSLATEDALDRRDAVALLAEYSRQARSHATRHADFADLRRWAWKGLRIGEPVDFKALGIRPRRGRPETRGAYGFDDLAERDDLLVLHVNRVRAGRFTWRSGEPAMALKTGPGRSNLPTVFEVVGARFKLGAAYVRNRYYARTAGTDDT